MWGDDMQLAELQGKIRARIDRGGSLEEIEATIIDSSALDEDQRAALWLYAWSWVSGRGQRAEVARLRESLSFGD
jgi:hypothetical protein